jgi:hypothetical protein
MSHLPCPTCGHQVASTDIDCPSCGLPFREAPRKLSWKWLKPVGLAALIGGAAGIFIVSSMAFAYLMIAGGIAFVVALALD